MHLTITQQSFLLLSVLQWKATQGGVPLPKISIICSSLAHIDWLPFTSRFPPLGLFAQGDCFLGYLSKCVCLVELMRLDLQKTVLEWYKTQSFSNPIILQSFKRLFRENIMHFVRLKNSVIHMNACPSFVFLLSFHLMRMAYKPRINTFTKQMLQADTL